MYHCITHLSTHTLAAEGGSEIYKRNISVTDDRKINPLSVSLPAEKKQFPFNQISGL